MERITAKVGEPFYESSGPPSLFAVGQFNGEIHLLRFGPDDQAADIQREAARIRRQWGRKNSVDNGGAE